MDVVEFLFLFFLTKNYCIFLNILWKKTKQKHIFFFLCVAFFFFFYLYKFIMKIVKKLTKIQIFQATK